MFDLYLLPVNQKDNQEGADLPGLLVTKAPRRVERTKLEDIFVAFLAEKKPGSIAGDDLKFLLERMAQVYYSSPGTITAGMRKAVDQLNAYLLKFNLKQKQPVLMYLNLAILRKDSLYLVHVGETLTCVMNKEQANVYTDSPASPSALGVVQGINLRFFQTQVTPGTLLVMTPNPAESWVAEMSSSHPQPSLESQRRRLLQHAEGNQQALIWQVKSGNGVIHLLKRRVVPTATEKTSITPEVQESGLDVDMQNEPLPEPTSGEGIKHPSGEVDSPEEKNRLTQGIFLSGDHLEPEKEEDVPTRETGKVEIDSGQEKSSRLSSILDRMKVPKISLPKVDEAVLKRRLASGVQGMRKAGGSITTFTKTVLSRLLPGTSDKTIGIPSSVMLFIAIAVPLVVVAVSATVYLQRGLGVEQKQLYQEAQETVGLALAEEDATLQRIYWDKVLQTLDKVDSYGETEQSKQLRSEVLTAVDKLDGIVRVEVSSVTRNQALDANTSISRIVASDTEFFLLDRSHGRILRMFLAGDTYQLDEAFECITGTYPVFSCSKKEDRFLCEADSTREGFIGPPVDVMILPVMNAMNYSIMALDVDGNLMYCKTGQEPVVSSLAQPNQGWGQITSFSYENTILYVMDKANNALYYSIGIDSYFPLEILNDENIPVTNLTSYFTGDYVPDFAHIHDMKVNGNEVLLLKDDGTMISCLESNGLRCSDPIAYGDIRAGNDTNPVLFNLSGENFTQMQITQPTIPAIFLLDESRQAIYQFTWRLNLVRQLRARGSNGLSLPNSAPTAFAITPNHVMIVAYENQVFFGELP